MNRLRISPALSSEGIVQTVKRVVSHCCARTFVSIDILQRGRENRRRRDTQWDWHTMVHLGPEQRVVAAMQPRGCLRCRFDRGAACTLHLLPCRWQRAPYVHLIVWTLVLLILGCALSFEITVRRFATMVSADGSAAHGAHARTVRGYPHHY